MVMMMPATRLFDDASGNREAEDDQQRGCKQLAHDQLLVTRVRIRSIAAFFPLAMMPPMAARLPTVMPPPAMFLASRAAVGAGVIAAPIDRLHQRTAPGGRTGICCGPQAQAAQESEYR